MKKLIIVYVVLIIAVVLLAVFRTSGKLPSFNFFGSHATASVNGKTLNLFVAKSEKDRVKGLSGRQSIKDNEGMVFIFNQKNDYSFWMKGMLFPIDIIWIDDNTVVYMAENVPSGGQTPNLTIYKPDTHTANRVLEINAGLANKLGIQKGTKITFKGI